MDYIQTKRKATQQPQFTFPDQTTYPAIFVEEIDNGEDVEPSRIFTITITSDIVSPDVYDEVVGVLTSAKESDIVVFLINSIGGELNSLTYLTNAIDDTEAHVVGKLMGIAASAAGALFLNCHKQIVGRHTTMMIHNASYGSLGKDRDVLSHVLFTSKQNERFVRDTYKDFLTEEEIESVINGAELYFDDDEIEQRLAVRDAVRNLVKFDNINPQFMID